MSAAPQITPKNDVQPVVALDNAAAMAPLDQKTTGEKWFNRLRFGVAEVFILVATAGIAYIAKYGPEKLGPVTNYLRKFSDAFEQKLFHNSFFPLSQKSEAIQRLGFAAIGTTLTLHGGNFFAPIMYWLNNSKEKIVTSINRRFGKPGEVEAGKERLKDAPKSTFLDILASRAGSWMLVFVSFVTVDLLLGKEKIPSGPKGEKLYYFDKITAWGGKMANRLFGYAPEADTVASRLGQLGVLDIGATTASITLWTSLNELLGKRKKMHAQKKIRPLLSPATSEVESVPQETLLPSKADNFLDVGAMRKETREENSKTHTARLSMRAEPELSMGVS